MRSVADDLRRLSNLHLLRMPALDRVALALRLGDDDVALYQSIHGASEREARAALRRSCATGRVPSRAKDL